ncbi:MAG: serine--tRNA ligase, partial [Desulfobaccales bacterium]|nr:serine--tRNA ligase [Desulfobaccales bacterium]
MLDLKFIREHLEMVEQALKHRGLEISLEEFQTRDEERRRVLVELEALRHERNTLSKEVGLKMKAGKREEAQSLKDPVTAVNEAIKSLEAQAVAHDAWVRDFLLNLPNLPHASVPVGASSDDNPVVRTWGEPPAFDFAPRPHW